MEQLVSIHTVSPGFAGRTLTVNAQALTGACLALLGVLRLTPVHIPSGILGALLGLAAPVVIFGLEYKSKKFESYNFDPKGVEGAFEPFLAKYIRTAEFIIGLATGSIVLLVGSSVLHGQGGHLAWFFASPLLLLAFSVVWGISFMVWLIFSYEEYRHENPHTAFAYSLSEALGFASLFCFCAGYVWLIIAVLRL